MECSLLGWLTFTVFTLTGAVITWYTVETYRLRREAQRQTELQIRPFLSLVYDAGLLRLYNFGRGVARSVRPHDLRLSEEGVQHPVVLTWTPIDFIAPDQQRRLDARVMQDGEKYPDPDEAWRARFGVRGTHEHEIVIDYEDLMGNGYVAGFQISRGVVTLAYDRRRS